MSKKTSYVWRGAMVVLIGLMAVGTVGCRRRGPRTANGGLSVRYQRNLLRLAARATGCSEVQLTPMQIGAGPDVYTVTGCQTPVEYWLRCGRRGRRCRWEQLPTLNQQAAAALQCQPQMIQQQLTQQPNTRVATGCGRQAMFGVACNGESCGWAMASNLQTAGGAGQIPPPPAQPLPPPPATASVASPPAAASVASPPATASVAPAPAATATGAAGAVIGQLQAQREAILSCTEAPSIDLTIRWTAQGQLLVQLPQGQAGTPAEGCIQAALGTVQVPPQQAGEVTVRVQ